MSDDHPGREAVGSRYAFDKMLVARERSWAVLEDIRAGMQPGISEPEAHALAKQVFDAHGVERVWHPILIRIGPNTTKTYRQRSAPDIRLGTNDSYFIDLGLVFDGHEGDVGATFTVGEAPERAACGRAAQDLFNETARMWRDHGLSGKALYNFAHERAEAMGWRFNHAIKGHRVSDFPHSVHKGGDLGDLDHQPAQGLWILEIQLAHPTEPFGAFYEDLLIGPAV